MYDSQNDTEGLTADCLINTQYFLEIFSNPNLKNRNPKLKLDLVYLNCKYPKFPMKKREKKKKKEKREEKKK